MIVSVKAVQSKHLFPIIKSNLLDVKCKEFQYSIYKKKDFMYKVLKTLKYIYVFEKREYNTQQGPCLTSRKGKRRNKDMKVIFLDVDGVLNSQQLFEKC